MTKNTWLHKSTNGANLRISLILKEIISHRVRSDKLESLKHPDF